MADFRFTNEHSPSELGNVVGVLERPRLWIPSTTDYPDYLDWVQKTEAQIAKGNKRAMLGYAGRVPIGTVVYQRHETRPYMVEIRNISVSPDARGRYVGSFLLRNTEVEATTVDYPECSGVVVDTKTTNTEMIGFLMDHGYRLEEVADLYGLGAGEDAVFVKSVV
jgi:ribosomal protein S18 acetylase RimI-like enzyme